MSYLTFPRIHFSGQFRTYPSTINNVPTNYEKSKYSHIENTELGWGPKGNGEFTLVDCKVTMVEYEDGTSAITTEEDPIIGQPFAAVTNPGFIAGALVDLDPEQQAVSEIWGMKIQIGGDEAYLKGNFAPAAFNSMWQNVQGNPPPSSASASASYQSVLTDLETSGLNGGSRFLDYFAQNPAEKLSINFMVDAHNNNPVLYSFNTKTFDSLKAAGVTQAVIDKLEPMTFLFQNSRPQGKITVYNPPKGDVPTKDFVIYQLKQFLNTEEYNASIDAILKWTQVVHYTPFTPYVFPQGFICGTVGTSSPEEPDYFVPSRMLALYKGNQMVNFAPFALSEDGQISINLSNSLPVDIPGIDFYEQEIGKLRLVYFSNGEISVASATTIASIPYMDAGFLIQNAGMFTTNANVDLSATPLGVISTMPNGSEVILLAENKDGYYLRANQYVFRMNPGVETTKENPRGETATVEIYALKFGAPVANGTQILMSTDNSQAGLRTPESALTVSPLNGIAETQNGIATFTFTASDPGNPRVYLNGQLYYKNYGFSDQSIAQNYVQDPTDFISVQVYNQHADEVAASDILNKYGYLYKIMGFLTNDEAVEGVDMRNMIKLLLQKPFSDIKHMPITRDLSMANRQKIIDWIDQLTQS